jgi:hypothetical protein
MARGVQGFGGATVARVAPSADAAVNQQGLAGHVRGSLPTRGRRPGRRGRPARREERFERMRSQRYSTHSRVLVEDGVLGGLGAETRGRGG